MEAIYMSDSNLRFVMQGRDMDKKQNHLRIFDFKDNKYKELY